MPTMSLPSGFDLYYQVDDFTDPWCDAETVVLFHGNAESGEAWRAWVPHLARRYRVVRPDLRGFGQSTPTPIDFPWTMDILVDDLARLSAHLGLESFHLVAAKFGGTIALKFAAEHPEPLKSLTVIGTPPAPRRSLAATVKEWVAHIEKHGVESWARQSMRKRLGSQVPEAMIDWWSSLMGRTSRSTQLGFMRMVPTVDVTPELRRIQCPTFVITTTGSGLGSVEDTMSWQKLIPHSELLVIEGDSYHVAAVDADRVALAVAQFLQKHGSLAS